MNSIKMKPKIAWRTAFAVAILGITTLLMACGAKAAPDYETVAPAVIEPGSAIPVPVDDVVLTLTGDIAIKNVGDTLQFDMPTLENLGLVKYTVDDPWLNASVTYTGVLMSDLRNYAGASESAKNFYIGALDDSTVTIPVDDVEKWPILLATRSNGDYMSVGAAGPTRIILPYHKYNFDRDTYNGYWIWNLATMEIE